MWWKESTHWKRPWCWERLKVGGEGDDRGWDGWLSSLSQGRGVWANSGRWWRTGKPGVLQSLGSQRQTWLRDWKTNPLSAIDVLNRKSNLPMVTALVICRSLRFKPKSYRHQTSHLLALPPEVQRKYRHNTKNTCFFQRVFQILSKELIFR